MDNRKHPIRGLWKRNGIFVARITVEDDAGLEAVKWVPLEATTAAEAKQELHKLTVGETLGLDWSLNRPALASQKTLALAPA